MKSFAAPALFLLCLLLPPSPAEAVELTVYTDIEPDRLKEYATAFTARHRDITIDWVRDSAGPVTARLLAEKDSPKADLIFGLSLSSILFLDGNGLLESYAPPEAGKLAPAMRDTRENPTWVAVYGVAVAFIVNKPELLQLNLPAPRSFADLADPKYKGLAAMPNPVSSGTGYTIISGLLQTKGEENGWAYLAKLHENIRMYVHSGSKPAQMAAQGEVPIGLSTSAYAASFLARKAPIEIIYPEDGAPWDMAAAALVKRATPDAEKTAAAKKMMDFACSPEAAKIALAGGYLPNTPTQSGGSPVLLPMDFTGAGDARKTLLLEWEKRFANR